MGGKTLHPKCGYGKNLSAAYMMGNTGNKDGALLGEIYLLD